LPISLAQFADNTGGYRIPESEPGVKAPATLHTSAKKHISYDKPFFEPVVETKASNLKLFFITSCKEPL
jgi:hypothetical protein